MTASMPKQPNRTKLSDRYIERLKPPGRQILIADLVVTGLYLRVGATAKSKSFVLDYSRLDGSRARYTIGSFTKWTVTRARERARELQDEIRKGGDPQTDKKLIRWSKDFALGPFVELPLTETGIAPSQQDRMLTTFGQFYSTPMPDLTEKKLEAWRSRRLKKGITPGTCNRDRNAIRAVLNRAVKLDIITVNPLANWEPLDAPRENRTRFLSPPERKRLKAALKSGEFPEWFVDINHVALLTCMRLGEILTLQYEDLYMHDPFHIRLRAVNTKTSKSHNIRMHKEVIEIFKRKMADNPDKTGLCFPSGKTGLKLTSLRPHWGRLMATADIKHYSFHCHRHSGASQMVMNGVPLYTVSQILNHSSIDQTSRYAHLSLATTGDAINKID